MIHPADIQPDVALKSLLVNQIRVGNETSATVVPVYADWERPTNGVPDDFIVIFINGDIQGVGMDTPFARGNIIVSLYDRLNDDGSVKKNRINKVLKQFDLLVEKQISGAYYFEYEARRFITPPSPNQSTGYSVTNLNLRWNTTSKIINQQNT